MTDQSVFESSNNSQATPESTSNPLDALNTQLASIKNENGEQKYKNLGEAINALKHSQEYIPQVKSELKTKDEELVALKAKLEATSSVEETVKKLTEQGSQDYDNTNQNVGLDEQAVLNLINSVTEKNELETRKAANANQVNDAIASRFGDKAQEVVANKAKELGTTPEALKKLSEESPQVVLQLFGASTTNVSPTTSSINISSTAVPQTPDLQPPEKSLLRGASLKEQTEYMKRVRDKVYQDYGINQ